MKQVVESNIPIREDIVKTQIQSAVSYYDDIQKVRIGMGNRICAAWRTNYDLSGIFGESNGSEDDEKKKAKLLNLIRSEYTKITDYYVNDMKEKGRLTTAMQRVPDLKLINNKYDLDLIQNYEMVVEAENKARDMMTQIVKQHPMWDGFFKDIKGCGPSIAGKLIAKLDVHRARHVACFWSYCGVGTRVNKDGERVAQSKQNLTTRTYIDKNGEEKTCPSLGYSPELHSLVCNILLTSILRSAEGSKYWQCYYDYKNRYANRADLRDAPKMRIHRMAARQVAKALLRDLWCAWRSYEGYTLTQPYEIEYLGYAPHKYNEAHSRMAQPLDKQLDNALT